MAGAQAIQIGTAIMHEGIESFQRITDELNQFMDEHDYHKISDMVGCAHGEQG